MSLYELSEEELAIEAELIENGGELTPELEERLRLADEGFEQAAERRVKWIRTLYARATARGEEAARIGKLARSDQSLAERLIEGLKQALMIRDRKRLDLSIARITVQRNSAPSIRPVVPLEQLPKFLREEVPASERFSYTLAVERWKLGEELPGCEVTLGSHLRGVK